VIFVFSFVPKFGDRKLSSPNPDPGHRKQVITQRQWIEGKPAYEYYGTNKRKTIHEQGEEESKIPTKRRKTEEGNNSQAIDKSPVHDKNEQKQNPIVVNDSLKESQKVLLIFNILERSTTTEQFINAFKDGNCSCFSFFCYTVIFSQTIIN
jgi:hypothetical protein